MSHARILLCLGLLACVSPSVISGQNMTVFKTGENTTGMTKQCFYDGLGSTYTKTINSLELCPLNIQVVHPGSTQTTPAAPPAPAPTAPAPSTITAMLKGEQTTGMTKQCFYDFVGSEYTRTISSVALCPLTMQFSRR